MLRSDPRGGVDRQGESEHVGGLQGGGFEREKVGEEAEHDDELVAASEDVGESEQRVVGEQKERALHARAGVGRLDLRLVPHARVEAPVEVVALLPEDGQRHRQRHRGGERRGLVQLVDRALHLPSSAPATPTRSYSDCTSLYAFCAVDRAGLCAERCGTQFPSVDS